MTRVLTLLLLVANALYYARSAGALQDYGFAPQSQSEPQHLAQQIRPQALRVMGQQEFKLVQAQAQADEAALQCLRAGPFDDAQKALLTTALEAALPPGVWQWAPDKVPARWIIYMGKYSGPDQLRKKHAELLAMGLNVDILTDAVLAPGLSLGSFDDRAQAEAALARLQTQGVRTARVLQERPESNGYQLRLSGVDDSLRARLADLKPALGAKALQGCS